MTAPDPEANRRSVLEYHRRLWQDGDLAAVTDSFAADAVVHVTGFDGSAVDTIRDDAQRYQGAFTDISSAVVDVIAEGDRVVLHWRTVGRHVGIYGKVAATGKEIVMAGIDIFRLADGLIVECWSMWDGLDVYDQMGVLPELW